MLTQKLFLISSLGHELTLWLLLVLSVLSFAVAMERFFFLKSWKRTAQSAKDQVQKALEKNQLKWIKNLNLHPDQTAGMFWIEDYLEKQPRLAADAFESFILSKKNLFSARLSWLATIGSNAPFIGLLGTIFGVMDAFYGLSSSGDSSIMMLGISKALLATAVGLVVALPSILFYNFLRRQAQIILNHFEYIKKGYVLYSRSRTQKNSNDSSQEILNKEILN